MATQTQRHDMHQRLAERLREQADDIRRLYAGLDEETLAGRQRAEKWSLKEVIAHIWRCQEVFEGRIEALLTQTSPSIVPYDPAHDMEFPEKLKSPAAELLEGFLTEREQLVTLLDSLSNGDWRRSGIHPEYPHYDLQFQVEAMTYHEAHHIYQIINQRAPMGRIPPR